MSNQTNPFLEGFKQSPIPPEALSELEAALGELDVSFDNTQVRTHAMGSDIVVDASWTEFGKSSSSGASKSRRIRRSYVFFHRPDTTLPEFSIHARRGIAGKFLLGAASRLMGMPNLELEDEPEFNEKFTVNTSNPESVKTLLVRDVIDALVAIEDVQMTIVSRGVLFTRHPKAYRESHLEGARVGRRDQDERLDGRDRVKLIEDAITASAPIVDDPDAGRRAADAVEGSYAEEAVEHLTAKGGMVGRAIAKILVTSEMLDQLRSQPVPRRDVAAPIKKRAWGSWTLPFLILLCISLGAIVVGFVVAVVSGGGGMWWVLELVGLLFGCIAAYVGLSRQMFKRVVVYGEAMPGRITSVEKTNTSVNDDVIHEVTIQLSAPNTEPVVVKAGSNPAKTARRMMERGQETWVLVDPKKTSRGVWPEGWSFEALAD